MKYILLLILVSTSCFGGDFQINAANFINAPKWLKSTAARKVVSRIERKLEWSTRRVKVIFYNNQSEFEKAHSSGAGAVAVTRSSDKEQLVFMGPKINKSNFSQIFGHELVHVIFFQKYRGAIPKWLEEGWANHLAKPNKKVDYKWLSTKPFPADVKDIVHMYSGSNSDIRYHYEASLALIKMISKRCDIENLLRLSVERKMQDYLKTYCEIHDLNQSFRDWVRKKSKSL